MSWLFPESNENALPFLIHLFLWTFFALTLNTNKNTTFFKNDRVRYSHHFLIKTITLEVSQESILLNLKNKKMFPEFTHSSNRSKYTFNSQKLHKLIQLCILSSAIWLKCSTFFAKYGFAVTCKLNRAPEFV